MERIPPASGAVVMGTGIASIGLSSAGQLTLSRVLLAITVLVWLALGAVFVWRLVYDRTGVGREAQSPAALTGVAGTAVLGSRLSLLGWTWGAAAMLAIALCLWLLLIGPVLRNWVTPTVGLSLVLTVATESLAVLAAGLASRTHALWLLFAALVPFVLGCGSYLFVLMRFDLRQLTRGCGDHWITGGALAISALAAGQIAVTARDLHELTALSGALKVVSLVLWLLAMAWLPVLVASEVLNPRLRYDLQRWGTVFPVGMYAVCSFVVGTAANASVITDFARVWVWVGFALWLVVFAATLRRIARRVKQDALPRRP